ncbi:MAG: phosphatidylserine decarboxylase family protein [Flavobacteriales bacterium]|nr:phosphatidylserine decarboxylase family protein [Flavobacteriales bacterium]
MNFHREGRTSILIATLVSLSVILLAYVVFADFKPAQPVALAVAAFLMFAILQFFRNPRRRSLRMDDVIIAPADGKVVVIEEVEDHEYFQAKVRQISIFMSPTNVHINWYPVSGKITYSKYHPGKYLVAWNPKSSTDNERHSVVINHPKFGDILAKQIAGAMARRIVNYATVDKEVAQGEELGFIKFGSRVDVLIPLNAKVEVNLGDKTIGGQTVLASFSEQ